MITDSSNSVTHLRATHLLLLLLLLLLTIKTSLTESNIQELLLGFKTRPDTSATASFLPLLHDPTGNLSLGFLRTNRSYFSLAVLHLPSSFPLWSAPESTIPWSDKTELSFTNGSLVITAPDSRVLWSTANSQPGDKIILLNNSNLQIQKHTQAVVWQSFDFPGNTLIEGQNFTDAMRLVSSNGLYSMRLGENFMGLYAVSFKRGSEQIYWKHTAMQARAEIVKGKGPLYARVEPDGYLGMYQTGTAQPVDVQPFTNFQKQVNGLIRVGLEPDGNLKGYYWDGSNWILIYQAIGETCELPSPCSSYGLCKPGSGCFCLDNRTEYVSGGECSPAADGSGDFCGVVVAGKEFGVLRRKGVELPYKELMGYETTSSLEECEGICEKNCSCWGAVYNNASGFCYTVEYPIQTLASVGDESEVGYFKVREGAHKSRVGWLRALIGVSIGVVLVLVAFLGFVVYKKWWKRKNFLDSDEISGVSPGPYKDLGSASFRSLEMCNR